MAGSSVFRLFYFLAFGMMAKKIFYRKIYLGFFLCLVNTFGLAQVDIGIKGGGHVSQVLFEPNIGLNFDFLPGIETGIVAKVSANPNVALQAELNFSQKGWIEDMRSPSDPQEIFNLERTQTFRYNYLQVPILTHIYVGGEKFKVFLNLGPHFALLMGADSSRSADAQETDIAAYRYESSTAVNFEYGVTAGAGINFTIGKSTFQAEARLTQGLNNIVNRDSQNAPTASLNQVAGVSLTYFFRLKDKKEKADVEESP